jgi:predicted amidohydrolase
MRVGACQTPEILADVDAALQVLHEFTVRAEAVDLDLLMFPECFLQGYMVTEQHVRDQAFELGSPEFAVVLARLGAVRPMLVFGMIERAGGSYYNTAVVVQSGQVVGAYRKTFLTAGEPVFTPGTAYPVFDCATVPFGINICYDTQFPSAAAAVADGGARVLLVPAQNMMRRDKALLWHGRHNQIRAQRARETGMWLVSADVTGERGATQIGLGPTSVINPAGDVVVQVPVGTIGMTTADIS